MKLNKLLLQNYRPYSSENRKLMLINSYYLCVGHDSFILLSLLKATKKILRILPALPNLLCLGQEGSY